MEKEVGEVKVRPNVVNAPNPKMKMFLVVPQPCLAVLPNFPDATPQNKTF